MANEYNLDLQWFDDCVTELADRMHTAFADREMLNVKENLMKVSLFSPNQCYLFIFRIVPFCHPPMKFLLKWLNRESSKSAKKSMKITGTRISALFTIQGFLC
jgi:hypothetical protein